MIEIIQGDITKLAVDAIVNAANSYLKGGGGVDGAIHRAGGKIIDKQCREYVNKNGTLPTGEAMLTDGGNMSAKFVIHTVGPVWNGGSSNEWKLLTNAYANSLKLASEKKLGTIAFPNISTGVYGYPKEEAAKTAIYTVSEFLKTESSIEKVIFCCWDYENYVIYNDIMKARKNS